MNLGRLLRRSLFKQFVFLYPVCVLLLVLWNESLIYYFCRFWWRIPEATSKNSLGVLLVADPQLIGYKNEPHMVGPLTRWDSDRFLLKGFSHALSATNPDLIIFLGDLFDEGLEANDSELQWTLSRFQEIFDCGTPKIFISGDNDVGGEMEPVQSILTTRFSKMFRSSFPLRNDIFNSLTITEVNLMNGDVTKIRDSMAFPQTFVLLSHVPLAVPSYHDPGKFIAMLTPDLIFSAHEHKAAVHHISRSTFISNSTSLTGVSGIQKTVVGRGSSIFEIQAPTCSYRSGFDQLGGVDVSSQRFYVCNSAF
ncbi:hypothetical protein Q1695_005509 [Nippostrongylus brasiliensis]|nr:hypothetical protein Q1695_005509 [Nippostrongylus brasiliensis]